MCVSRLLVLVSYSILLSYLSLDSRGSVDYICLAIYEYVCRSDSSSPFRLVTVSIHTFASLDTVRQLVTCMTQQIYNLKDTIIFFEDEERYEQHFFSYFLFDYLAVLR